MVYATNGQNAVNPQHKGKTIHFGGDAQLIAFVGHNGLMDNEINPELTTSGHSPKDVIILACYSQLYFTPWMQKTGANPILWSTHLMAPEAYTLESGINDWMAGTSPEVLTENAAQTYHSYQKCGIRGARNLLTYGYK